MVNNISKLLLGIFSWFREIGPKRIRSYIIMRYFIAVFAIVLQCLVIGLPVVEGNEKFEFGGGRFYFRNGLTESWIHAFIPMMSNGIQSFQLSQYFVPEFDRSLCNSAFSIVTVSDISNKGSQQYSSQDSIDIVKNDSHYFLGLPWWVWLIIISSIIFNYTQRSK